MAFKILIINLIKLLLAGGSKKIVLVSPLRAFAAVPFIDNHDNRMLALLLFCAVMSIKGLVRMRITGKILFVEDDTWPGFYFLYSGFQRPAETVGAQRSTVARYTYIRLAAG